MTADRIRKIAAWAAEQRWMRTPLAVDGGYAECAGHDDPVCGLARFSLHGCAGAPTRAEFIKAIGR